MCDQPSRRGMAKERWVKITQKKEAKKNNRVADEGRTLLSRTSLYLFSDLDTQLYTLYLNTVI